MLIGVEGYTIGSLLVHAYHAADAASGGESLLRPSFLASSDARVIPLPPHVEK